MRPAADDASRATGFQFYNTLSWNFVITVACLAVVRECSVDTYRRLSALVPTFYEIQWKVQTVDDDVRGISCVHSFITRYLVVNIRVKQTAGTIDPNSGC